MPVLNPYSPYAMQWVDPNGNAVTFNQTTFGSTLPITSIPTILMFDNFNGSTIDTVTRWSSPVLAGTGTITQSSGNLVATVGTTASNGAAINTQETFEPSISGDVGFGSLLTLDVAQTTNASCGIGFYTRPASFTAATPVQDGYLWERDIAGGGLRASTYSGGVRVATSSVFPVTSPFTPVRISYSPVGAQFYFGLTAATPSYTSTISIQPGTLNLPFGFHSINHTSGPSTAPTWTTSATAVTDSNGVIQTVFNGQSDSRARSPNIFININNLGIATEQTIWTPASGRKFRLMGYVLESGTVGGNVLLKDNTGGTTKLIIPFGAANGVIVSPPMGNGILSVAANNVLTATGSATQTLSGYVFGTEE